MFFFMQYAVPKILILSEEVESQFKNQFLLTAIISAASFVRKHLNHIWETELPVAGIDTPKSNSF